MTLIGRLHPLLVHFPIALVLVAAVAELVAILTTDRKWHVVAVANMRAGAAFAVAAAIAGWLLASSPSLGATPSLEWHRWLGTIAAIAALGAALASEGADHQSRRFMWRYRIALFWAAALVGVAGHLGGTLVWGAEFLRP